MRTLLGLLFGTASAADMTLLGSDSGINFLGGTDMSTQARLSVSCQSDKVVSVHNMYVGSPKKPGSQYKQTDNFPPVLDGRFSASEQSDGRLYLDLHNVAPSCPVGGAQTTAASPRLPFSSPTGP